MNRSYALRQLLRHGELTRNQIRQITGWTHAQVSSAIVTALNAIEAPPIRAINIDGRRYYAAAPEQIIH